MTLVRNLGTNSTDDYAQLIKNDHLSMISNPLVILRNLLSAYFDVSSKVMPGGFSFFHVDDHAKETMVWLRKQLTEHLGGFDLLNLMIEFERKLMASPSPMSSELEALLVAFYQYYHGILPTPCEGSPLESILIRAKNRIILDRSIKYNDNVLEIVRLTKQILVDQEAVDEDKEDETPRPQDTPEQAKMKANKAQLGKLLTANTFLYSEANTKPALSPDVLDILFLSGQIFGEEFYKPIILNLRHIIHAVTVNTAGITYFIEKLPTMHGKDTALALTYLWSELIYLHNNQLFIDRKLQHELIEALITHAQLRPEFILFLVQFFSLKIVDDDIKERIFSFISNQDLDADRVSANIAPIQKILGLKRWQERGVAILVESIRRNFPDTNQDDPDCEEKIVKYLNFLCEINHCFKHPSLASRRQWLLNLYFSLLEKYQTNIVNMHDLERDILFNFDKRTYQKTGTSLLIAAFLKKIIDSDKVTEHYALTTLGELVQLHVKATLSQDYIDYIWTKLSLLLNNFSENMYGDQDDIAKHLHKMAHKGSIPRDHLRQIVMKLKELLISSRRNRKLLSSLLMLTSAEEQNDLVEAFAAMMADSDQEKQKYALMMLAQLTPILPESRQAEIHEYMMRLLALNKNDDFLDVYEATPALLSLSKTLSQKTRLFHFCYDLLSHTDMDLNRFAIDTISKMDLTDEQSNEFALFIYRRATSLLSPYDSSLDRELIGHIIAMRFRPFSHDWRIRFITLLSSFNANTEFTEYLSEQICRTLFSLSEELSLQNNLSLQQTVALMSTFKNTLNDSGLSNYAKEFIDILRRLPAEVRIALLSHTDQLQPGFAAQLCEEIHIMNDLPKSNEYLTPDLWRQVYKWM